MAEQAKVTVTQNGQRVPDIGDIIVATLGDFTFRYIVTKIEGMEGNRFALVPLSGLFAGRVMAGNSYRTLVEMYEQLNENKAMFVVQGSTWRIEE